MTASSVINMDSILNYINSNTEISRFINRVVPHQYKNDMKQHLIIQISKINIDKLEVKYKDNTLKYLAFTIISNQMSPKCGNCFYKLIILPNNTYDINNTMSYVDEDYEEDYRIDKIDNILRTLKPWKVDCFNLYYREGMNFREIGLARGMNEKTVQSWVYQIRDILKQKLK